VVLCGCESWTITKTIEGNLAYLIEEILRKIDGSNCVKGVWIIK
jgi:hypothetical protein